MDNNYKNYIMLQEIHQQKSARFPVVAFDFQHIGQKNCEYVTFDIASLGIGAMVTAYLRYANQRGFYCMKKLACCKTAFSIGFPALDKNKNPTNSCGESMRIHHRELIGFAERRLKIQRKIRKYTRRIFASA